MDTGRINTTIERGQKDPGENCITCRGWRIGVSGSRYDCVDRKDSLWCPEYEPSNVAPEGSDLNQVPPHDDTAPQKVDDVDLKVKELAELRGKALADLEKSLASRPGMLFTTTVPPETLPVPTCETCRWFREMVFQCRRHAPGPNGWPTVLNMDSCGDYERAGGKR